MDNVAEAKGFQSLTGGGTDLVSEGLNQRKSLFNTGKQN